MKHIDLFSGIGGFALACDWLGIETILFCEIDDFCQKVLRKHWPGVPIVKDVNDVEEIKRVVTTNTECSRCYWQKVPVSIGRPQQKGDVSTRGNRIILTAGFPCQPFSNAGRKRGARDDRYLWPQTFRVIEAVRPSYVLLENVAGILNMVFPDSGSQVASQASLFGSEDDQIADYNTISGGIDRDLRQAGYETLWLVIPACSIGAPHRRDRVWIVAHPCCNRGKTRLSRQDKWEERFSGILNNSPGERNWWQEDWYEVAARFCRVDDAIPNRVDRLKSLGNAIVPGIAFQILQAVLREQG